MITPNDRLLKDFTSVLQHHADRQPDAVALIDRGTVLTYAELSARSEKLAAALHKIGVRQNDRMACWLPNSEPWLVNLMACARLGVTIFFVNTRFRSHEVEDIISRGRMDWLLMWPGFKDIPFGEILSQVGRDTVARLKGVICYDEAGHDGTAESQKARLPASIPSYRYYDLMAQDRLAAPAAIASASGQDIAVFTTSGTTSKSKFVLHKQGSLINHGKAIVQYFGYDTETRVLAAVPFCGVFGFATFLGAFLAGIPLVCDPVFDATQAVRDIEEHGITHTYVNNEVIKQFVSVARDPSVFRSVRYIGFGSFSPNVEDLAPIARNWGLTISALYGSSELMALTASQPFDPKDPGSKYQYHPGGRLVQPGARVRARDPITGKICGHGVAGELEIFTPSHMSGYLDQPEVTARAFTEDDYFRTGDQGYTISDRQYVFESRSDDAIRLSGFLVNPVEIENVLQTLPGIAAAQVVSATKKGKQIAFAFVIMQAGHEPQPQEWTAACRKHMASFKVPGHFEVVDAFPSIQSANSTRVQRKALREMAEAIMRRGEAAQVSET